MQVINTLPAASPPSALGTPAWLGLGRAAVAWALAGGIALGVAYAASPLTVWFVVAMGALFAWAGRGLAGDERRLVLTLLGVAVALRVLAIVVLFLVSEHDRTVSFFWDGDGMYMKQRSLWIRSVWLDRAVGPAFFAMAFDRMYGWTTYLYVLGYLQYLVGPAPYGVHLLNVTTYVTTAVLLHRLVRPSYGRLAALLGFGLMLFLPTPFAWSVSALKEAPYGLLVAVSLVALVATIRGPGLLKRAGGLAVLLGAVAAIDSVRVGAFVIVAGGLLAGLLASAVVRRFSLMLLMAVLVPVITIAALRNPAVQSRVMVELNRSAVMHIGNVRTTGNGYKLLDDRFYSSLENPVLTPREGARFVVRALASFVVVPLPWQVRSRSELVFLPQQGIWYVLVLLAVVGLLPALRRDALVTCTMLGVAAAGAAAVALNSGNVGTLVRHRDTVVPFVLWLGALGGVVSVSALISRSRAGAVEDAATGPPLRQPGRVYASD